MFLLFPCHRLIQRSFEAFVFFFFKSCSADSRQNDLIFNYAVQIFHNVTNDGDGRRWRSAVSVAATTLCGVFVFFCGMDGSVGGIVGSIYFRALALYCLSHETQRSANFFLYINFLYIFYRSLRQPPPWILLLPQTLSLFHGLNY